MNEMLLKCPFCGSPAELQVEDYGREWWVECTNPICKASSRISHDREKAIDLWNARA